MSNNTSEESFMDRHHFLLRRLHSLTGIVPIGAFLFPHLTTNSSIMWGLWIGRSHLADGGHAGVETFQHEVNFIHSLPFLILIEIFGLWLPIAFHAALGIYFALSGRSNVKAYGYGGNWRYTLQRLSGYLGVAFIFLHISALRWGWSWFGLFPNDFQADYSASTTAMHFQDGGSIRTAIITVFYLVCVLGLVFHFANGLWTAAITWGLTISEKAQDRWGYVCLVVGLALSVATILSVVGFNTLDVDQARQVEERMLVKSSMHGEDGEAETSTGDDGQETAGGSDNQDHEDGH